MAEKTTAMKNNGGEEPPEIISPSSQAAVENNDVLPLDKQPAAMETAVETSDHDCEEPSEAAHPSHQVNEENYDMIISSDEEPATAEITAERTETPDNKCTEEPTSTDPAPQAAEESDGLFSVDEDPVAIEVEERNHEAEIFAGFSLESNGIRFRGPRSGKTVRGELLIACMGTKHMAFTLLHSSASFL